ncbi:Protein ecm33 [Penicillium rolfsii]|nr:Protein ecm33 [Penicillium rolfsii]
MLGLLAVFATLWQVAISDSNICSSSVTISSQSDADNLANCDTLHGSLTIASSVSGTITLNNIEEIKGSFTAERASGLTGIMAPNLETIEGVLTLENLESLTDLTMSALSVVSSGITITDNSKLRTLSLGDLERVNGQLKLIGSFTSVSLPSLDEVNGETTIRGSSSMSCSAFKSLQSQGVYRGSYSCMASGSNSSLSPGAQGGIAVGVILGVLLILLVFWYVLRARRHRKPRKLPPPASFSSSTVKSDEKPPSLYHYVSPRTSPTPPIPRKPLGPPAAQLDGRSIHEVPNASTPIHEYHELDAGPVFSSHQRPIHSEA